MNKVETRSLDSNGDRVGKSNYKSSRTQIRDRRDYDRRPKGHEGFGQDWDFGSVRTSRSGRDQQVRFWDLRHYVSSDLEDTSLSRFWELLPSVQTGTLLFGGNLWVVVNNPRTPYHDPWHPCRSRRKCLESQWKSGRLVCEAKEWKTTIVPQIRRSRRMEKGQDYTRYSLQCGHTWLWWPLSLFCSLVCWFHVR